MIEPTPTTALIGRWGVALCLVIAAVLVGGLIRDVPYLLPNRLPGLVLYELVPGIGLGIAIGTAIIMTHGSGASLRPFVRLALFALAASIAGVVMLAVRHDAALQGQWF